MNNPFLLYKKDLPKGKLNVTGRVTICGPAVTVNSNGKLLEKQDAIITDESGSIKVVFWQGDHKKIASGETHKLTNIIVKSFQNAPYLTLTRDSTMFAKPPFNVKMTIPSKRTPKSLHFFLT